jgi:hypothetical protein
MATMSEPLEEVLREVSRGVTRAAVERFAEVRVADYRAFTEDKKREYREAVSAGVAWAMLSLSPFLRTCIRIWGLDVFITHLSTAIQETWPKIDATVDDYARADSEPGADE